MRPPTLAKGRALVLRGPQGCGKTRLAHELAAQAGGIVVAVDAADFDRDNFDLGDALAREPRTCIIEGMPRTADGSERLKNLITADSVVVHRKMLKPCRVKAPNFVAICVQESGASPPLSHSDRRFFVVDLPGKAP